MNVYTTSPLRVDIGGGVTDIPEIGRHIGTSIVNLSIDLYEDEFYKSKVAIEVSASTSDRSHLLINNKELDLDSSGDFLQMMFRYFLGKVGLKSGASLRINNNLPQGTGLGGSAALSLSTLASIYALGGIKTDTGVINTAHHFETIEQGIQGGFQDYIATYFGGLNYITSASLEDALLPSKLSALGQKLPTNVEDFLNQNMIFVIQRSENVSSGVIVKDEVQNFLHNQKTMTPYLKDIKHSNEEIHKILGHPSDVAWLDRLAKEVNLSWGAQKRLSKLVGKGHLKEVEEAIQPFVYGLRGPGAGGSSLFFMAKPSRRDELIEKLHNFEDKVVILYGRVNKRGLEILVS